MRFVVAILATLFAGNAMAADMTVRQKAAGGQNDYAAAPNWGGLYVGGHVGYAMIDTDPSFVKDFNGYVYGGHLGYQVQKGWFVGGIEAGITNYAGVKTNGFGCDCIVGDLLGKVGVATGNFLWYGVGGGFWHNASLVGLPQFGWTVGAGVDWQPFGDHVSIGGRYQYRNLDVPNTTLTVFAHEFKLNLDYKF